VHPRCYSASLQLAAAFTPTIAADQHLPLNCVKRGSHSNSTVLVQVSAQNGRRHLPGVSVPLRDMAGVGGVVAAKKMSEAADDYEEVEEKGSTKVIEGWFVKKAPKNHMIRNTARKRWFVLYGDGLMRYFTACSPDGEPAGEKVRCTHLRSALAFTRVL
jgi:hypothetical protein